ncbi:hypothetical protein BGX28_008410 [Mortierella sp. GBA30]|nr:hypothetical protein BGX28_008410 [Mortierella sp. GBA30]
MTDWSAHFTANVGADLSDKDKVLVDVLNLICPQISKPKAKKASVDDSGQNNPPSPTSKSEEASDDKSAQSDPSDEDEDEDDSTVDEAAISAYGEFLLILLQLQYTAGAAAGQSMSHCFGSLWNVVMRMDCVAPGSNPPLRPRPNSQPVLFSSATFKRAATSFPQGILPSVDISIQYDQPAIINFVRLNKLLDNRYTTSPLSPIGQPYVRFSETNLLPLLWSSKMLADETLNILGLSALSKSNQTQSYAMTKLASKEPGYLLTRLVTSVGRGTLRGVKGYRRKTTTMSLEQLREDLATIRADGFRPSEYTSRGYVPRGSIRTNGLCLQLLAYKMKELRAVKYKRLLESVPPERLTSTVVVLATF